MDVIINQNRFALPTDAATWGDVLDWIETKHLDAGQCITRVMFEGREELNYRRSEVCDQPANAVGSIQIESGDFSKVLRESLCELAAEIASALDSTRETIRLFENRNEREAYSRLHDLLDSIRLFHAVFAEDLGWSEASDLTPALENAIQQLISAQERRFWVSVCDVLEYELTPILESWQKTVESTRARLN